MCELPTLKTTQDGNVIMYEIPPDMTVEGFIGNYEYMKPYYEKYANKDKIAIDVGAWLGGHTMYLSKLFKKVYSFEPQKYIYLNLCANLFVNKITNVTPINKSCYKTTTRMTIPLEKQIAPVKQINNKFDYWSCPSSPCLFLNEMSTGEIEAITLDSLNLTNVGLIKIDAQGQDLYVLEGARNTIYEERPIILFELEYPLLSRYGLDWENFNSFFIDYDYKIEKIGIGNVGDNGDYLCIPKEFN